MTDKSKGKSIVCTPTGPDWGPFEGDPADLRVTWTGADRSGEYRRDGDPQPGRYARNGVSRSLLPRRHGPPRDEGAWARRVAEIRREREAENAEVRS